VLTWLLLGVDQRLLLNKAKIQFCPHQSQVMKLFTFREVGICYNDTHMEDSTTSMLHKSMSFILLWGQSVELLVVVLCDNIKWTNLAGPKHTSFPVLAVFLISATSFFSCEHPHPCDQKMQVVMISWSLYHLNCIFTANMTMGKGEFGPNLLTWLSMKSRGFSSRKEFWGHFLVPLIAMIQSRVQSLQNHGNSNA
jgi:hypothetical protein